MSYFQTDDIPQSPSNKPKPLLRLISPSGMLIFDNVKSWEIRGYYRNNYAEKGCNGKRIWREELLKLGYNVENKEAKNG